MNSFVLGFTVMLYFLALVYLGWMGYKKTSSSDDYLVGGRQMNPIVMALSYGATFISASAIVGFGGVAAVFGMGIEWLCFLNMFVGVVIAFIFFGRPTRRLGAKLRAGSFAELMGSFYQSRAIRVFMSVIIFIGMPIYAAVVLKGGAVFVERMFGVDYDVSLLVFTLIIAAYVIAGGMKGVMYTDALQAVIMFVCMLFLSFWIFHVLGMGVTEANSTLTHMADQVPDNLRDLGHQGWTAMPSLGSPQWYTLVTSLILGVGIGCLAQPQLVVRFMTVKSTKQLNQGVLIGCVFLAVTVGVIYYVGALSNLFFMQTEGKLAVQVVPDMDKIIPYFISKAMPEWFSVVFMLCIISASMSTLSAQFHTMGAAVGSDIYSAVTEKKGKEAKKQKTGIIRLGVLVSILISYVICYSLSAGVIAKGTSLFMGVCASTFLPAYFCALYWKGVTRQGAYASMWTGALVSTFCMLFLHEAESKSIGLCQALFGTDTLFAGMEPWFRIDPILFAFPLSVIVIVVVSKLTKKK